MLIVNFFLVQRCVFCLKRMTFINCLFIFDIENVPVRDGPNIKNQKRNEILIFYSTSFYWLKFDISRNKFILFYCHSNISEKYQASTNITLYFFILYCSPQLDLRPISHWIFLVPSNYVLKCSKKRNSVAVADLCWHFSVWPSF